MTDARKLKILAPTRYPWRFNSPRMSCHDIETRQFIPFNKMSAKIEGITVFNPLPVRKFDLIHAFNRIPLGGTPFIIGFESHLPRAFGLENSRYFRFLSERLAGERCGKIIAISKHAAGLLQATHGEAPYWPDIENKLTVRYPNMVVPSAPDAMKDVGALPLVVTFVGSHFGRKGGCVAVKMAEKANARGFPLIVQIVSALEVGGAIWTDPPEKAVFEPYLKLLSLPNVHHFPALPNGEVLERLRGSHFSILTTFSDTFGYSAIESMMNYTPVIATRQGALPEFIRHGENGMLLDLPVNSLGEWSHQQYGGRECERYRRNYADEIERMSEEALNQLMILAETPARLHALREAARLEAVSKFDHISASSFWDRLYIDVIEGTAVPEIPGQGATIH